MQDDAVVETAPLVPGAASTPMPAPWSPLTRALFRVAFVYFMLFTFCFGNGTIFGLYGSPGSWIEDKLSSPFNHLAEFVSVHLFHFTGIGARFHDTGSGDTQVQWVLQLLFAVTAIVGGLVWTTVATARGHRRVEYGTLHAWLRFLLRLTCGMFMMGYGLDKLFPMQMAPISIGILNEPVGNMSPMTFLWAMIGMNPGYEMMCGAAEVLGAMLILFRRTALAGALLSAFVMSNVLLYNMFFDVPVKLFAANLLLALVFITVPDLTPLFRFFWLHQPSAPVGVWVPPAARRNFRVATRVVELIFVVTFLVYTPIMTAISWRDHQKALHVPNPLLGAWKVEVAHTNGFESPEHEPLTELYVDDSSRGFSRSTGGQLWRTRMKPDPAKHTLRIGIYVVAPTIYAVAMPDNDHATLTAVPPEDTKSDAAKKFKPSTVVLTRVPVPSHYPLLDRGFHWVNEWGLER